MSSVVAMTLTVSYNYRKGYPFSTYGELIFIMVQSDILILLVVHFNDGGVGEDSCRWASPRTPRCSPQSSRAWYSPTRRW